MPRASPTLGLSAVTPGGMRVRPGLLRVMRRLRHPLAVVVAVTGRIMDLAAGTRLMLRSRSLRREAEPRTLGTRQQ